MFEKYRVATAKGFYNGNGVFVVSSDKAKTFSRKAAWNKAREAVSRHGVFRARLQQLK